MEVTGDKRNICFLSADHHSFPPTITTGIYGINWLTNLLTDRLINWMIDWLIDWPSDSLSECYLVVKWLHNSMRANRDHTLLILFVFLDKYGTILILNCIPFHMYNIPLCTMSFFSFFFVVVGVFLGGWWVCFWGCFFSEVCQYRAAPNPFYANIGPCCGYVHNDGECYNGLDPL